MIIGERLKQARKNKKMSQQELGDALGVTKVSICGYETGVRVPTMENFVQLINILDLSPDYLLGRDVNCVSDEEESYNVKLAREDLEIIKELKNYSELYKKLRIDPKRTLELIDRKLKK